MPNFRSRQPINHLTTESLTSQLKGRLIGDPSAVILCVCPLESPVTGGLAFFKDTDRKKFSAALERLQKADTPRLSALIVDQKLFCSDITSPDTAGTEISQSIPLVIVANPLLSLSRAINLLITPVKLQPGVHPSAVLEHGVSLGTEVSIGAFCYVGQDSVIGDNTTIFPHVTIYPEVKIGQNVTIHAGAVLREGTIIGDGCTVQNGAIIGADGFGYTPDEIGDLQPVPQIGSVALGAKVDIGASACVDRATLGQTKIEDGAKIDNLVQIGHNVVVGKHSIICAQSGIAGSSTLGERVILGGQTGVPDHVKIASGSRLAAKTGVIGPLNEKGDYAGYPCQPIGEWRRQFAALRKLPELLKTLKRGEQ